MNSIKRIKNFLFEFEICEMKNSQCSTLYSLSHRISTTTKGYTISSKNLIRLSCFIIFIFLIKNYSFFRFYVKLNPFDPLENENWNKKISKLSIIWTFSSCFFIFLEGSKGFHSDQIPIKINQKIFGLFHNKIPRVIIAIFITTKKFFWFSI